MRWMNAPTNKMLEPAKLSYATLFGTIFEKDADKERRQSDEPTDILKLLEEETEVEVREDQALQRSQAIRKKSDWLPEKAIQNRKAFFCAEGSGYLQRKVSAPNPMNMMGNPDMMNKMLKQNIQSVIHMFMFTGIGSVFQGFITA